MTNKMDDKIIITLIRDTCTLTAGNSFENGEQNMVLDSYLKMVNHNIIGS